MRTLLKWIRHSTRTGRLLLTEGSADSAIDFLDGEIVSAQTGAGFSDLGTILLESKVISIEQLLQAVDLQRRSRNPAPLGRTLIKMGCATTTDIRKAMRLQVDQVIEPLLALTQGCFKFHAAPDGADDITQNVSDVVREADVRRMYTP